MSDDDGPPPPSAALARHPAADDALAACRPDRNPKPADRPIRKTLESRVRVELPAPRVLARVWALPTLAAADEVYSSGAALVRRPYGSTVDPTPADFLAVADELRDLLAALPDRDDACRAYTDARIYALDGDPRDVRAYLCGTIKAVRIAAPRWRVPAVRQERTGPPMTTAERVRKHRSTSRAAEEDSASRWLAGWIEEATPGTRVPAVELYADARDVIEEWAEDFDDGDRVPGPRVFYAVADRLVGPRRYYAGTRCYVAPARDAGAVVLIDATARVMLDELRPALGDFLTSKRSDVERQAA